GESGDDVYGYGGNRSVKVGTGRSGKYSTLGLERARRAGAVLPPPTPPIVRGIPENSPG
ncbi:MAG: hypothetical protein IIA54_02045, partial [Chloroflexi bacterium]|nr:hypothetical protein [Chloroflexota bacterium]